MKRPLPKQDLKRRRKRRKGVFVEWAGVAGVGHADCFKNNSNGCWHFPMDFLQSDECTYDGPDAEVVYFNDTLYFHVFLLFVLTYSHPPIPLFLFAFAFDFPLKTELLSHCTILS